MMEDEVVQRRRWLTREQFLDYLGATNLIPGPNSTELAIHIGHARAGWPGLVVAGSCFILPAALIVTALAWGYVEHGHRPDLAGLLHGVKPVVIAIVLHALWRLGRTAIKARRLALIAVGAVLGYVAGIDEIPVLVLTAIAGWLSRDRLPDGLARPLDDGRSGPRLEALVPFSVGAAGIASVQPGLLSLFWFFAKVGSVLFGSGYVLFAFLRSGLVTDRGWLTETQLLDAIAIGQVTPGPLFTTATFIGYLLGGGAGAVVATIGIFLPAFIFVALSGPLVPRIRRSPGAAAVLDGVNAASLSLMAVVAAQLGRASLTDWDTVVLAAASAVVVAVYRINPTWLLLAGGVAGVLLHRT